jgi:hypothetical protein
MRDASDIVRDRQKLIRREIDRRGISIKAIQLDGGWSDSSTVLSYFPASDEAQPAVMSVASLYRLMEGHALPLDLLSVLLPDGFTIVRVPENVDHDEISELVQDYLREKERAHHPDSPAGRDIAQCEDDKLRGKVAHLKAVA